MANGIFVGLATIDLVYSVDSFPAPNTKITATGLEIFTGGPATNAAVTFAHLGGHATLATAIGHHPIAKLMRTELAARSIQLVDLAPDSVSLPAVSAIVVNRSGERNVVSTNASAIPAQVLAPSPSLLDSASILLVDGHHLAACIAWARAARARHVPVVFDEGSFKPGSADLLAHVDVAICSADFHPPGCSTSAEVFAFVQRSGVPYIAITHGSKPIEFVSASSREAVSVPAAPIVDTTGAGDVFHGAFCHAFAAGLAFEPSLRRAALVASHSCRYPGTRDWMNHPIDADLQVQPKR